MGNIVLVNGSGLEISNLNELMEYVIEYLDFSTFHQVENTEETFYSLLLENDIIEDDEYRIETLRDGFKILKAIEPGYWHIEK